MGDGLGHLGHLPPQRLRVMKVKSRAKDSLWCYDYRMHKITSIRSVN